MFSETGFHVFDPEIPDGLLTQVMEETRAVRWRAMNMTAPGVRLVAHWPKVIAELELLYNMVPRPFQTLNFRHGTEQAAHSDTIHFNSVPSGRMCGVWVAMEDIDADNGPLMYYPGSHREPEWTMEDAGAKLCTDGDMSGYTVYEAFIRDQMTGREPSYGILKRGEAIVWASNLIHGGSAIKDKSRTRFSQVTHYFFPAERYTSMISGNIKEVRWL